MCTWDNGEIPEYVAKTSYHMFCDVGVCAYLCPETTCAALTYRRHSSTTEIGSRSNFATTFLKLEGRMFSSRCFEHWHANPAHLLHDERSHLDVSTSQSTRYRWLTTIFIKCTRSSRGITISGTGLSKERMEYDDRVPHSG